LTRSRENLTGARRRRWNRARGRRYRTARSARSGNRPRAGGPRWRGRRRRFDLTGCGRCGSRRRRGRRRGLNWRRLHRRRRGCGRRNCRGRRGRGDGRTEADRRMHRTAAAEQRRTKGHRSGTEVLILLLFSFPGFRRGLTQGHCGFPIGDGCRRGGRTTGFNAGLGSRTDGHCDRHGGVAVILIPGVGSLSGR
jgi:hypothetical protein